jgi:hypothetical protein
VIDVASRHDRVGLPPFGDAGKQAREVPITQAAAANLVGERRERGLQFDRSSPVYAAPALTGGMGRCVAPDGVSEAFMVVHHASPGGSRAMQDACASRRPPSMAATHEHAVNPP